MVKAWLLAISALPLIGVGLVREGEWALSWAPQGSALAHEELPFYSHADLQPRWDGWSRRRTVGRVTLRDAADDPLDERAFAQGPTVVSFFWTGCGSVCPTNIDLLRGLKDARVLLVSDQPLVDTPGALRDFQARRGLPTSWRLTTGAPQQVYGWARAGLFIDVENVAADGGPPHAEVNFLIDRRARLRGVYDANSTLDAARLQDDIQRLRRADGTA